jgi:hypothetical protein
MTLADTLVSVWNQVLVERKSVLDLGGEPARVRETRSKHLRSVQFVYGGRVLEGIEQNPRTASRWAKQAQEGKQIMQFSYRAQYIGNVCDGRLFRYAAWDRLDLPE